MNFVTRLKNILISHKKLSILGAVVVVVAIVLIVRSSASGTTVTTYVLGTAEKGTIVSTVSGIGQVETSNNLAVTPQVAGTLERIMVAPGDTLRRGQVLFRIDATDAEKSLRDAKLSLASAQLALDSFKASTANTQSDQATAIANAYTALLNSGPEAVPSDITTRDYGSPTLSGNYTLGKEGTIVLTTYSSAGGVSFQASGLVNAVGLTSSTTPQPIGDTGLLILFPGKVTPDLNWTITLPNKNASGYLSNYNAYQSALTNQNQSDAEDGVTDLDLRAKELSLTQAQNSLIDAETNLAKYTVTAPFDGTMASVPVTEGQQVSSGTTLGMEITHQQVASIPLNEVDAAKVALGQKATMTFDAIDGLTITGRVAEIDNLGTVSQGVVNYTVKIAFDTEDPRVKSGMSVSASIATDVRQDVITVPSGAIKSSGGSEYVLTATSETDPDPKQVEITTGISDDTNTEVTSGLTEGQSIVVRTVTSSGTAASASTAPSILGSIGGRAGASGGAALRTGGSFSR